jgi:hypothetical protein
MLLWFGLSPGDDLLCTAVLRELRNRGYRNLWMVSNFPELFCGVNDASRVLPVHEKIKDLAMMWRRSIRFIEYEEFDGDDRSTAPVRHIIAEMCSRAGVIGDVSLRPYLSLSESEKAEARWAHNRIAIQSSGLAARLPMLNKQWFPDRFQMVVDALRKEVPFIQIGSKRDPLLRGVKDFRGMTTIRESAAILHHARLFVGIEGFLMHLARANECPSVIIYGGRTAPWQTGYICNTNMYSGISCSPCWRLNKCELARKCMRDIESDDVVIAVRELLARNRNPLSTEVVEIR